jgi:hypothetical protein
LSSSVLGRRKRTDAEIDEIKKIAKKNKSIKTMKFLNTFKKTPMSSTAATSM